MLKFTPNPPVVTSICEVGNNMGWAEPRNKCSLSVILTSGDCESVRISFWVTSSWATFFIGFPLVSITCPLVLLSTVVHCVVASVM